MSRRRKRKTTQKLRDKHPRIVGNFYRISDKNGGHPARVYYSEPVLDIYYVQRFSRERRKGREKLLHSIDPEGKKRAMAHQKTCHNKL